MRTISGLTPQREQILADAWISRNSATTEKRLGVAIRRALIGYAKAYGNDIKRAKVEQDHRTEITTILTSLWSRSFKQFGKMLLDGFKSYDPRESVKANDVYDQAFKQFLMKYGAEKVTQITNTTKDQAVELITRAIDEAKDQGLGQNETAKLIQSSMRDQAATLSTFRARMIARTEAHSAATSSNQAAAESTGLPLKKRWVSAKQEGRTRPTHLAANGQTVGMNENFIVGGEPLFVPGDPSGSAANIISCRCIQTYLLPD